MEFHGKLSIENLPWKFHGIPWKIFRGISMEDFPWNVFHGIPWNINMGASIL